MGLTYEDDIMYSVLPMYHSAAHVCLGVTITEGNTAVTRKKFSATKFWEDCVKNNVTVRMSEPWVYIEEHGLQLMILSL